MNIVDQSVVQSPLEQRLVYAKARRLPFTPFFDNVPKWTEVRPPAAVPSQHLFSYPPAAGSDLLREAIASWESDRHQLKLRPENVLVTAGALHALHLVFKLLRKTSRGLAA